jgi:hypothetical protein
MTGGYWQLHSDRLEGGDCIRLTHDESDKRSLRAVSGTSDVIYRDNEGRLFRQALVAGAKPVPLLPQFEVVKDFDLHPERGYLVSSYAPNSVDTIRIWWVPPDHSDRRLVVAEAKLNEMPRWHTERQFYFVRAHRGQTWIWRGFADAAPAAPVFASDEFITTDPAPSPDGRRLAYCRDEGEGRGFDLWVASEDGTGARRTTAGQGMEAEPCWSPDGNVVFFSSWDGRNFRIARIDVDGGGFAWISPEGMDCRTPAVVRTSNP